MHVERGVGGPPGILPLYKAKSRLYFFPHYWLQVFRQIYMPNRDHWTKGGLATAFAAIILMGGASLVAADTIIKNADGSSVETRSDGTKIITNADGSSVETRADGTKIITNTDKSSVETKSDGTKIIINADRSSVEDKPDGTEIIKNTDGSSVQTNPDGSKIITNADGTQIVEKAK